MAAKFSIAILVSGLCLATGVLFAQATAAQMPELQKEKFAEENFGADAPWFLRNIPFLEIDDPEIQQIYYYRWKLYRSHIREIGQQGTTVLEFLDDVPWAREPYTDLNDSSSFHIMEGRWLRSPAIVDSLIDHLYSGAGNDRHFSESIAAAVDASTRVTGDAGPGLRHLDSMRYVFNAWDDHFDWQRNLYWIEPILDATEYTISSIDATGAGFGTPSKDEDHNGFREGFAFRPTINSYQYANALAIARFAGLAGEAGTAAEYTHRADRIRAAVLDRLWNAELQHFTDRYQRSTPYVTEGQFIRGREMAGYLPWFYELPPRETAGQTGSAEYAAAWRHVLSSTELAGPYGLRTVEPSYPRYLAQYRYDKASGKPECQWNGPSWPFQTSQTLTALANLLNDYDQAAIHRADYLRLLRQYTQQHFHLCGLDSERLDRYSSANGRGAGSESSDSGGDRTQGEAHSLFCRAGNCLSRPRSERLLRCRWRSVQDRPRPVRVRRWKAGLRSRAAGTNGDCTSQDRSGHCRIAADRDA